jgi:hypothetical protein
VPAITAGVKGAEVLGCMNVSTVFMGMTVGCAKGHGHTFDPIKQTHFSSMKALFDPLVQRRATLATPLRSSRQLRRWKNTAQRRMAIDKAIDEFSRCFESRLRRSRK